MHVEADSVDLDQVHYKNAHCEARQYVELYNYHSARIETFDIIMPYAAVSRQISTDDYTKEAEFGIIIYGKNEDDEDYNLVSSYIYDLSNSVSVLNLTSRDFYISIDTTADRYEYYKIETYIYGTVTSLNEDTFSGVDFAPGGVMIDVVVNISDLEILDEILSYDNSLSNAGKALREVIYSVYSSDWYKLDSLDLKWYAYGAHKQYGAGSGTATIFFAMPMTDSSCIYKKCTLESETDTPYFTTHALRMGSSYDTTDTWYPRIMETESDYTTMEDHSTPTTYGYHDYMYQLYVLREAYDLYTSNSSTSIKDEIWSGYLTDTIVSTSVYLSNFKDTSEKTEYYNYNNYTVYCYASAGLGYSKYYHTASASAYGAVRLKNVDHCFKTVDIIAIYWITKTSSYTYTSSNYNYRYLYGTDSSTEYSRGTMVGSGLDVSSTSSTSVTNVGYNVETYNRTTVDLRNKVYDYYNIHIRSSVIDNKSSDDSYSSSLSSSIPYTICLFNCTDGKIIDDFIHNNFSDSIYNAARSYHFQHVKERIYDIYAKTWSRTENLLLVTYGSASHKKYAGGSAQSLMVMPISNPDNVRTAYVTCRAWNGKSDNTSGGYSSYVNWWTSDNSNANCTSTGTKSYSYSGTEEFDSYAIARSYTYSYHSTTTVTGSAQGTSSDGISRYVDYPRIEE